MIGPNSVGLVVPPCKQRRDLSRNAGDGCLLDRRTASLKGEPGLRGGLTREANAVITSQASSASRHGHASGGGPGSAHACSSVGGRTGGLQVQRALMFPLDRCDPGVGGACPESTFRQHHGNKEAPMR